MRLVPKLAGILAMSASAVLVGYGYLTVDREEEMLRESVVADARIVARVMRRSFIRAQERSRRRGLY